jgi:hypothetical protein
MECTTFKHILINPYIYNLHATVINYILNKNVLIIMIMQYLRTMKKYNISDI